MIVIHHFYGGMPRDKAEKSLRLFAEKVLPPPAQSMQTPDQPRSRSARGRRLNRVRFGIHLPNSGVPHRRSPTWSPWRCAPRSSATTRSGCTTICSTRSSSRPRPTRSTPDYYNKSDMPYYDALTTLSVVAGATARIGLGTRVLLPVLRPPAVLAKQIGTLAALAGPGRVVIGVGAGWLVEEFEAVGIDPAERFARLDEHVAAMRAIWRDGVSAHDGRFYRHAAAGFHPVPPDPVPILVGGGGPGALRRVARWGDGWALPNLDVGPDAATAYRALLDRLGLACEAEGRDPATVRLVASAPLSAPRAHFELLAELGIDDVDLMPTEPSDLDLDIAEALVDTIADLR